MSRPTGAELVRETEAIRFWLRACGIPAVDLDDTTCDVIAAAWESIDRGLFDPYPEAKPRAALRTWLHGVTWRRASTYHKRAFRRHEVLVEEPSGRATTPEGALLARDELELLTEIAPRRRAVLLAFAAGLGIPEIAAAMGANESTTWGRLRQGRLDLLAILRREAAKAR